MGERAQDIGQGARARDQSRYAERLLIDWEREKAKFWQIVPKEMIHRFEQPVFAEAAEKRA